MRRPRNRRLFEYSLRNGGHAGGHALPARELNEFRVALHRIRSCRERSAACEHVMGAAPIDTRGEQKRLQTNVNRRSRCAGPNPHFGKNATIRTKKRVARIVLASEANVIHPFETSTK